VEFNVKCKKRKLMECRIIVISGALALYPDLLLIHATGSTSFQLASLRSVVFNLAM
jgi:hypothetical protein